MKSILQSLNPAFKMRCRIRATLRGYAHLCKEKRLGLVRRIKSDMTENQLPSVAKVASPFVFGASIGNAERVVRQYLLERHLGASLNRAILLALGSNSKVVYPLPRTLQNVLIAHGLSVDTIRSSVAWGCILSLHLGRNLMSLGQMLLRALVGQFRTIHTGRYAYLDGLNSSNLPQLDDAGRSYDICSWYAQWEDRVGDIEAIRHNVQQAPTVVSGLRVESMTRAPYLLSRGAKNIAQLATWCLGAMLVACFDLLRGRWWHALLLAEAGRAKAMALTEREFLAADYLFHYSGSIYRPMWTYEAEKKGSRIVCYFYSVSEQPKLATGYESQKFEWGASSWPLFLVWDKYQKELLRGDVSDKTEIRVVGPIWFSVGPRMHDLPPRSVAVFDVEAYRLTSHFPFSTIGDYVAAHPDFSERFLHDVQQVLTENGFSMAFKKKRASGDWSRKRYKRLMQEIADNANVAVVQPNISPLQLIEKCVGMISMPFTSTALYLRERNIPSVYYDPTGWIQRDDRAAHGIRVLVGIDELRHWISRTLAGGLT